MFNPLPIIVTAVGGYMLVKLRGYPFSHPIKSAGRAARALSDPRTFRSFTLALAGTLGVGNVFGVCVGISMGGAGSVFWLLLSVIPSSVLKYSEVVLAADNLSMSYDGRHGGMNYVLRECGGALARPMSRLYAIAALMLSLFMGAALQSTTVVVSTAELFDTPPYVTSAIFSLLVLASVVGGAAIIEKITAVLMPVTTIVYIILTLSVIFIYRGELPRVLSDILSGAFTGEGLFGGFVGTLSSLPVREGFCRGILSNEAGAGTSSMAHSRGVSLSPGTSGLLGILEVVFDTLILCTLTALAVLTSTPALTPTTSPMSFILGAVSHTMGSGAATVLFITVLIFAYATVICWFYYGRESLAFLFGERLRAPHLLVYLGFSFFGFALGEERLVLATDVLLLALTLLTSYAIIKGSDRIVTLSEPHKSALSHIFRAVKFREGECMTERGRRGRRASLRHQPRE